MKHLAFLLIGLGLAGCSTLRYDYTFGPGFEEGKRVTFAMLTIPHPEFDARVHQVLGSGDLSLEVVREQLERRGLVFSGSETAEYLVGLRVELLDRGEEAALAGLSARSDALGIGFGALSWVGDGAPAYPGLKGNEGLPSLAEIGNETKLPVKLSVALFNSETRQLVWSGWAVGTGFGSFGGDAKSEAVLVEIMNGYPDAG